MHGKQYLSEKAEKKKVTREAMWVLGIFVVVFILMIIRIAMRPSGADSVFSDMPTGAEAFEIAKAYVKPTIKSPDAEFSDGKFAYSKSNDSVYVIKSYFEEHNIAGPAVKTNFTAVIKYHGGLAVNEQNWTLVNLVETR